MKIPKFKSPMVVYKESAMNRNRYSEENLEGLSNEEIYAIRKGINRRMFSMISLLLVLFILLVGVFFISKQVEPVSSTNQGVAYRSEEDKLASYLNKNFGEGTWYLDIYQTEIDAYRVRITLSDGTKVTHYYQVSNSGIYEVKSK